MIRNLEGFPDNVIAVVCSGRVTRKDYESTLVPAVEKALKEHGKIRLYYQTGNDFAGIDPGAVWADFRVGVEHLTRWERIAVVTDVEWIRHTMTAFSFLMPGEMKVFAAADEARARDWIAA